MSTTESSRNAPPGADAAVSAAIERHAGRPGALLPLLHDIQDALGYLPDGCETPIARALNLSRAEVHGVVSFYHHFRRTPPARHALQLCQAEACRSMGCTDLLQRAQARLDPANGVLSVEPVYCLGQCANAPAALVDGRLVARLTPARLDEIMDALRAQDAR